MQRVTAGVRVSVVVRMWVARVYFMLAVSPGRYMLRLTIAFAAFFATFACRNVVEQDAGSPGPLRRAFDDAANQSAVPVEVLLAIGYVETRWQMPEQTQLDDDDDAHGSRGAVGMMGIVERVNEPRLTTAARSLGVSAAAAREDPALNVRVAAEVLRSLALRDGALPAAVSGWRAALVRYGADGDEQAGALYARDVFDVIDAGAVAVASTGEVLQLVGQHPHKDGAGHKTQALVAGADSALVAAFVPAREGFYGRGRYQAIDTIVIHTTEGSYAGTIAWFRSASNPYSTSAHYVIRSSDGQVTQMVHEEDTAYHARSANGRAIGIEHEAIMRQARWFTAEMYAASAALVADICARRGIPADRAHIVGHAELAGNTHTDPGAHWDWTYYMTLVTSGQSLAPPTDAVDNTDACDGLDYLGSCAGDAVSWCANGQPHTVACGASTHCGWQDGVTGYNCLADVDSAATDATADDPCGGLDYQGRCDGDTLVWCSDDVLAQSDCSASQAHCGWQSATVGYDCLSAGPTSSCGDVDYAGRCDDDTLSWCDGTALRTTDCALQDKVCGLQSAANGYNCL